MIKAVIFDMDGLMFDTERLALPATAQAALECGWPMTPEDVLAVVGYNFRSAEDYYRGVYGESFDYAPVRRRALELMDEWIERDGIPVKDGLMPLLDFLDGNGIVYTVATGSDESTARGYFDSAGIAHRFGAIMSGEKVERGKPDPQIYLRAAELLGVHPSQCVVLEDSIYGIESAYRAGMTPIMIPDLIEPTENAKKMAYRVVGDLFEAENVIDMLTESEKLQ